MHCHFPDTCGSTGACKTISSSDFENAAQRLQSIATTASPKIKKLNHFKDPASPLKKGLPGDSFSLYHSEVTKNGCNIGLLPEQRDESIEGRLTLNSGQPEGETEEEGKQMVLKSGPSEPVRVAPRPPCSLESVKNVASGSPSQTQAESCSSLLARATPDLPSPQRRTSCSSSSRVASSRPGSRTASNSSGSPLGSPLNYPGTPRRNRLAAKFTNPMLISPSPPLQSDSEV